MAVVGLLGLAAAMSTNVTERTREFAIMHTIGATPAAVRSMVLSEGIHRCHQHPHRRRRHPRRRRPARLPPNRPRSTHRQLKGQIMSRRARKVLYAVLIVVATAVTLHFTINELPVLDSLNPHGQ